MYSDDIMRLLIEAGDAGLSLDTISKHVYNNNNSLFETITGKRVTQNVKKYLDKVCINQNSIIVLGLDNKYRLNPNAPQYTEQMLNFMDVEETPEVVNDGNVEELRIPFEF